MSRDCNTCHKNKTEIEFGCPYIGKEMEYFYDFPLYGDPDFGVWGCPTYYRLEHPEYNKVYKYVENGLIRKDKLKWEWRVLYDTIKDYMDLRELKDRKKNNGNDTV